MSHKGKNSAGSSKGRKPTKVGGGESKTEEVLQAVVLADSFQDRFKPFTVEKPRCLLPLANTPLIDYTLEFLAMNGVDEVYIYCGAHTDQVEDYINRSRWSPSSRSCPFSVVQFVRVSDARSVGDVLRDMDKRSLVDGDFILVHGDLVSNIILDRALAAHRKRREASAANIMTTVLRSGGPGEHRTKTNGITPIFVVDTKTQRLLHYDEMNPLQSDHYLALDPAIADELSTEFEVRSDLIDAQVDICTPEVLALWSESFDYELPRRNFLHGVLKDWELNGKMIYAEILEDGYAARASNLQQYDAISRDVLGRWAAPFIPEDNLVPRQTYQRHANGLVMEESVSHAHDTRLTDTIIGRDTTIGSGSSISHSVIGKGCKIGADVVIKNSYIWDNAIIEDGARISSSILADSVSIGKKCNIPSGSLISHRVRISDGTSLDKTAVLSTITADGAAVAKDTNLLGPDTNAAPFFDPEDDDLDEEDPARLQKSLIYSLAEFNLSTSSISTLSSAVLTDDEDDPNFLGASAAAGSSRSRLSSFASDDSGGRLSFHADAVHGLVDALRADSGDFDSAKLEFMGLRLANDASDAMMRKAVATAFARRAAELLAPEHGGLEPSKAAERALTARPGAAKFVAEVGVGGGGEFEQVEFALALQRALQSYNVKSGGSSADQGSSSSSSSSISRTGTLLAALLQQLYSLDILEEEGILGWWEDERAVDGEGMAALKDKCKVLVEWLENAEEEDEDDSDEEEESDNE
ncbi:translation initiation factor eIF-2B epsilon subunit, GEF [Purpureocillium takamizusanense]|uniref:Translation initiation factor eIF2B subunit epsilon n=1 Tax=Purpureocillium takamizusanense TaxID=2060973 RepID=A0A9Q8VA38_9HYPO|nr:translation initiation factor eIF-2B epsilon subunit, GEF [Purpureocillium takamizusanense]UNI17417.1 translation initiation factor eIF-2B epsilon subunit, GEF [Purpureocillium takamizusanense]